MTKAYMIPNANEVHHYTDTGGLIGIIENGVLWATNIQFLNDSLEYEFGLQKMETSLRQALNRLHDSDSSTPHTPELESATESAIAILQGMGANTKDGQFVCCLSRLPDDLSQWRGYAREGYCITFDEQHLTDSAKRLQRVENSIKTGTVAYDGYFDWQQADHTDFVLSSMHRALHDESIKPEDFGIRPNHPEFGAIARENNRSALAVLVCVTQIYELIPFIKSAGFADEQEMRIRVSYPESIKFRTSRIGPLPYAEVPFDLNAIKSITVGPGLNIELRKATLEYLLTHKFGTDHKIEIKETGLSFRG
ncbi:DUF2971 domain-containing protein [Rhodococcus aetherivorans]|uniref:DUF2971 domain-containing protein n=1 Tax=Rhodococcus aetherivorans TaxID=191292 RepID=UPI001E64D34F|nr:DUF2971 domain-containing protein [Rhodococcus aetherivorans]UGQ39890.1 DUF2971 domain-containing protein [Rhodococcus aetherivorans]